MKTDYQIALPEYFNWPAIISYLDRDPNEPMYQVIDDRVRRAFRYDHEKYLVEITYHGDYLGVKALNDVKNLSPIEEKIIPFIREWFDLDTDLGAFYHFAEGDDILGPLVKRFAGLRLVGMPDFYEAITWGILGQQINLAYTYTLKRRFTEKFGDSFTYEGQQYWIYPDPAVVATTSQDDLLALRLTHRKAEYLSDISKRVAKGEVSKRLYQRLKTATRAEKQMVRLRGIGPWTANYVLMRCLRMGDAFPMADIGLLNGIKELKGLATKPDKEYLLALKSRWQNWASYATFYIWRVQY